MNLAKGSSVVKQYFSFSLYLYVRTHSIYKGIGIVTPSIYGFMYIVFASCICSLSYAFVSKRLRLLARVYLVL